MMRIGAPELFVILVIAILVLGPDQLPMYAKKLGEGVRMLKTHSSKITNEIRENIVDPIESTKGPIKESILNGSNDLKKSIDKINEDINNIGKKSM